MIIKEEIGVILTSRETAYIGVLLTLGLHKVFIGDIEPEMKAVVQDLMEIGVGRSWMFGLGQDTERFKALKERFGMKESQTLLVAMIKSFLRS